jgi:hypothetical protein
VLLFRNVTDFNDEHPKKHSFPIEVTEFGIVILDKDEHPEKQ